MRAVNRLRELRECAELTQEQVGDRLGISQRRVSYHEQGTLALDATAIAAYAKLYRVAPAALFVAPFCARCAAPVQ